MRQEQQPCSLGLKGIGEARVAVPEQPTAELHPTAELFCAGI